MIPTELKMEDLSDLEKLLPTLVLNLAFAQGDRGISRRTALNRRVFVRLIDKAISEYTQARALVIAQIAEGQQDLEEVPKSVSNIYMFSFIDYMENCISTVRRILRFLERLKGNQDGLMFNRSIRKHIKSLTASIVNVRNAIEHMDEKIQNDLVQEDQPVMLKLADSQDGVTIAGESLKFTDLSSLLKQLHSLGKNMAEWRANDDHPEQQSA